MMRVAQRTSESSLRYWRALFLDLTPEEVVERRRVGDYTSVELFVRHAEAAVVWPDGYEIMPHWRQRAIELIRNALDTR